MSLDGKLRIYFSKSANPTVLLLSNMCVSHRDTTSLQPSSSRWQVASLREDGRAHTVHLFVFEHMCLDVLALAPTFIYPCGICQSGTSTPMSPDGRLRIYFGKNANPMALHVFGMCVCHHDTPVPNENATSLQASTSLRPSPPMRLPASDHEDGVMKLTCCSLEVNIQAHVRVNIHASLCCLVGFRNMFASTPWRIHAG